MNYKTKKQYRHPEHTYDHGEYFITICTKNRINYFGKIFDFKLELSETGKIILKNWKLISKQFENVLLDEVIIMPNHIHGIISIITDLSEKNLINQVPTSISNQISKSISDQFTKSHPNQIPTSSISTIPNTKKKLINNPMEINKPTLGRIIRWFKAKSTYEINKLIKPNPTFQWQSKYYDRIIRNEKELDSYREYIIDNPANWQMDELYS